MAAIITPKELPKYVPGRVLAASDDLGWNGVWLRARLADLGQEIFPPDQQTPDALGAFQKAEIEKWWPIIKAASIKSE
jgi:hypothetical protein